MTDINHLENCEKSDNQSKEFFNSQWKLYQKLVSSNYMGHRELFDILNQFFLNYFDYPFSLLDLGCGDSSFIAQALLNTNMASYNGVDISDVALEIARNNMARIPGEKRFIQSDFFKLVSEWAKEQNHSFDVILSSFAFHHLTFQQKDYLMGQIVALLKEKGVLIMIDIIRQENESRESYLKRYLDMVHEDWSLVSQPEYLSIEEHMSLNDFPETQETFKELAQKYNFSSINCLGQDLSNTAQLLCFYKSV